MQPGTYRSYLLVLLSVIMVFNYVDRLALGLVLQDIKVDLQLSDTQLGFLTGIAFAIFYAGMGIPIARWADRGNRVTIISLTATLWSAAVALCGAAANFTQLLLIRVGVAIGEAGCHPPAFSLIGDYYRRAERPRAIARYMLGWPVALLIGFFAAGWLNELYGWRVTFIVLGAPGIVLALLAAVTLKEPRRASGRGASGRVTAAGVHTDPADGEGAPAPRLRDVLRTLATNAAYRNLVFCSSLSYFFGAGIMQWQPAFFVRVHGFETGELGTLFALIHGLGGLLGTYAGGELVSRYAANNERLQLFAISILYIAFGVLTAGVYLVPEASSAFTLLAISTTGGAAMNGPMFAATQTLVPPRMRAMSIATMLFFCHLIGLGFGPLVVGAMSDALGAEHGTASLQYALVAMCPGYFWCAWHLWRASRTVQEDMRSLPVDEAPVGADAARVPT